MNYDTIDGPAPACTSHPRMNVGECDMQKATGRENELPLTAQRTRGGSHWPSAESRQPAARVLAALLDKLRSASAHGHRGRLTVVRALSTGDSTPAR
jgi:hypothetical protein